MVRTGSASSSVMVRLALLTVSPGAVPCTVIVSSSSSSASWMGVRVKVCCPLDCPDGMVRLKLLTAA